MQRSAAVESSLILSARDFAAILRSATKSESAMCIIRESVDVTIRGIPIHRRLPPVNLAIRLNLRVIDATQVEIAHQVEPGGGWAWRMLVGVFLKALKKALQKLTSKRLSFPEPNRAIFQPHHWSILGIETSQADQTLKVRFQSPGHTADK